MLSFWQPIPIVIQYFLVPNRSVLELMGSNLARARWFGIQKFALESYVEIILVSISKLKLVIQYCFCSCPFFRNEIGDEIERNITISASSAMSVQVNFVAKFFYKIFVILTNLECCYDIYIYLQ